MPAMTALTTFTNGTVPNAAAINNLRTNIDTLCQQTTGHSAVFGATTKPLVKVIREVTQSVPDNSFALINWTSAIVDTNKIWGAASPSSQLLIAAPGWYRILAQVTWALGTINYEHCVQLYINGTSDPTNVPASHDMVQGNNPLGQIRNQVHTYEQLAAGATIYVGAYQNSGAPVDVVPSPYGTWCTAVWDAPY